MTTQFTGRVTAISTKFISNSIQIIPLVNMEKEQKYDLRKCFFCSISPASCKQTHVCSLPYWYRYQRAIKKNNIVWTAAINDHTHHSEIMTADSPRQPQTTVRSTAAIYQMCQEQPEVNTTSCAQYRSIKLPYVLCCFETYTTYFTAFIHVALPFLGTL